VALSIRSDATSILAGKLNNFVSLAESLGRARFLVYKSEVPAPGEGDWAAEAEWAEMDAIAESFRCEIKQSDGQFSLMFYMYERDPGGFLEIVDAGMPAPLVGGDNGTAHRPDGSTYKSLAPLSAYGKPLDGSDGRPDFSKEGTGVINEIKTMLKSLFHDFFMEKLEETKVEIKKLAKQELQSRIHNAIGGS